MTLKLIIMMMNNDSSLNLMTDVILIAIQWQYQYDICNYQQPSPGQVECLLLDNHNASKTCFMGRVVSN